MWRIGVGYAVVLGVLAFIHHGLGPAGCWALIATIWTVAVIANVWPFAAHLRNRRRGR